MVHSLKVYITHLSTNDWCISKAGGPSHAILDDDCEELRVFKAKGVFTNSIMNQDTRSSGGGNAFFGAVGQRVLSLWDATCGGLDDQQ